MSVRKLIIAGEIAKRQEHVSGDSMYTRDSTAHVESIGCRMTSLEQGRLMCMQEEMAPIEPVNVHQIQF